MDDDPKDPDATETTVEEAADKDGEDSGIIRAVLSGEGESGPVEGPLDDLPRGTTIGPYVILSRLAAGSIGTAYAAFDPQRDRKIALKVLEVDDESEAIGEQRREALVAAANTCASVEHPGVVRVHDVGIVGSAVYVAMEFVDGIDLRQWMEARDDPFPWPEVLRVFRDAGQGLAAAHAVGCVHGDFTPSRVLMGKGGRICVFDFGLAMPAPDVSSPHYSVKSLHNELPTPTVAGLQDSLLELPTRDAMVGTPDYMAPELHAGVEPDAKADQFAFCAAMYEALYGEPPFKGGTPQALAVEAMSHAVRPAPKGSDVPQWLRDVLLRGLSPRRKDRYASMEVVLRHLEHDPQARRRRWIAGVTILGVGAGAAGGIAYLVERESNRCDADVELLDGTWDPATRASLEQAFLDSGRPHAVDVWTQVEGTMDEWSTQWLEHRTLACELRHADDDVEMMERRYACLDGVLQPFQAFATRYAEGADGPMVDGAQRVVSGLWRPIDCRKADMLDYAVPADGPAKQAADGAWLHLLGGVYETARAQAQEAAGRLPLEDVPAAHVRASLTASQAAARARAPDARTMLYDTAALAASARLRIPQAEAWLTLARVDTVERREMWLDQAQTLLDSVDLPHLRAELMLARGALAQVRGNDRDALSAYHRALALVKATDSQSQILRTDVLMQLAALATQREEWSTAHRYIDEVVGARETAFGPSHPELIAPLRMLASVQAASGDADAAIRALDRAVAIAGESDARNAVRASLRLALGDIEADRNQPRAAATHYERASSLLDESESLDALADAMLGLGLARLAQGAASRAAPALERAVLLGRRAGWSAVAISTAEEARGRALADEDPEAAREALERALQGADEAAAARLEEALAALPAPAPKPL
ncbi:MAG: protein kinase [Myxococcota bacterium]